ncbi:nucleoid-associated protein [Halomonas sp. SH5A2]|uniref:nucleoid-associated protein n=1 Tax=Halomonas sp. SH5A2 TaxID=2749040 RepID=UPI00163E6FC8|nr:nucleoid-associated protein [Halomonas sp. SH5A2]QNI03596.1 nucleoid-associated protein [Halomonas sp. SH5A2]
MFSLEYAVIHSFSKEAQSSVVDSVTKKPDVLDSTMDSVISLVSSLTGLLGKKGNNVVWGKFANDGRQGHFPEEVESVSGNLDNLSVEQFLNLSHLTVDELVRQAREEPLSTGGHVLVSLYRQNDIPFLLVASIKQRDGLRLNSDLVPIGVSEIDLSKIHQAANINLQRFLEAKQAEVAEEEEEVEGVDKTYLCFISKGDKAASGYFVIALGCTKGIASARATRNSIDLVYNYFKDNDGMREFRQRAKENVISYLQNQLSIDEPAKLHDICNCAIQALPAERVNDNEDVYEGLNNFLNGDVNQVPDEFKVNTAALKDRVRIKGKAPRWDVQFDKNALGGPGADVWFDETNRRLVLSNMPEPLVRKIMKEIRERE